MTGNTMNSESEWRYRHHTGWNDFDLPMASSWHTDLEIIQTGWLRLFTTSIASHAMQLITPCTSSKEVCSPQYSEQLFASLSLGVSATLLWFCSQKDFCPCYLGKCIYNILIQEFHIQQMVFLAMYSLWFLWEELSA